MKVDENSRLCLYFCHVVIVLFRLFNQGYLTQAIELK